MPAKRRYHISVSGDIVVCDAIQRACPRKTHFLLSLEEQAMFLDFLSDKKEDITFPPFIEDYTTLLIEEERKAVKASTPRAFTILSRHSNLRIIKKLIVNPKISERHLRYIYDRICFDQKRVSTVFEKRYMKEDPLLRVVRDKYRLLYVLQVALLANHDLPEDIVGKISKSLDWGRDYNLVATHPNVPLEELLRVFREARSVVRKDEYDSIYQESKEIYKNIWHHPKYLHYLIDKDEINPSFKKLPVEELIALLASDTDLKILNSH